MNKQARLSIEALPNECLFEIFRRLPSGQARSVSACVCKRWLMLISNVHNSDMFVPNPYVGDPISTRHLENPPATDISLASLSVGTSSQGGLRELKICFTHGVTDAGMKAIAYSSPYLRVLSLQNVPFVGDKGLLEIAKECHKLEKLDLCLCPLLTNNGLTAMAKSMFCLTSLVIEYCNNIGNESLQEIGLRCQKLNSVYIRDCPLIGDQGVASLVSSGSSVLSELKLQGLRIGDKALAEIGLRGETLTSLVLLELREASANGFSLMGKLGGLRQLVYLSITSCPGINDEVLHAIGDGCCSLKQIRLCECSFISDNGIRVFFQVSNSLESLTLEKCHGITLLGVLGAISSCGSKLQWLGLNNCMRIDYYGPKTPISFPCESLRSLSIETYSEFGNRSLGMVAKLCPYLQHIYLVGCCGITDSGLRPLLESCCLAGFIEVNLDGCANLTDEAVSDIAKLHGKTLEMLSLEGCVKVTDASLVSLASNCSVLEHLDVSRCSITDFGIATLTLEGLRELSHLSISGCSMVTDMSLPFLLKLNKKLSSFDFSECNSISDSTVRALGWDT